MSTIFFALPDSGNWLVHIIAWLVKITSSVGFGVILFTLLLKLITLPFDFLSRASMRKNSLKMEEMRPELERLQKQYANDKNLYNQKMMALYKKNGYSMWGSCLPTILTLVIFIVAINGFNRYSQFSNQSYFYNMTQSYNQVIYDGFNEVEEYVTKDANGDVVLDVEKLYALTGGVDGDHNYTDANGSNLVVNHRDTGSKSENGVNEKYANLTVKTDGYMDVSFDLTIKEENTVITYHPGNYKYQAKDTYLSGNTEIFYKETVESDAVNYDDFRTAEINRILAEDPTAVVDVNKIANDFIKNVCEYQAAETYRAEQDSFLWIKNIWASDIPWKHPVAKDAAEFNKINRTNIGNDEYAALTAKLSYEKTQANGYLILVVLTVATSFLSQWITTRSQKAQMELQTVDGQGMQTQKMMMWMMPIMMAVFAFIYTSAFAIYIILSSVLGLATTLLINLIVDRKYKSKSGKTEVVRSKVHTPKAEPKKKEEKKKGGLFAKKEEPAKKDFLSGLADKKKRK